MPKETATQRKRRLAKVKRKREEKLQRETEADKAARLAKRRKQLAEIPEEQRAAARAKYRERRAEERKRKTEEKLSKKMSYPDEATYVSMVSSFRTNDLQALLGAFNRNKAGRKNELKERALELLRTKPPGFNVNAFAAKISEIYRSTQSDGTNNNDIMRNLMHHNQQRHLQAAMQQQQRMYQQPPQYSQQPMQMTRAGLPQVMPQMQRSIYGSSNMPYYQNTGPRHMMSNTHNLNMMTPPEAMGFNTNATATSNNSFAPSTQSLSNLKLKKLPFYEVADHVVKPQLVTGIDRCTLASATRGMKEGMFKISFTGKQCTLIGMNRDISNSKNEYIYQAQIRICQVEQGCSEISDYMPLGLHIRLNNKPCPLPPTAPNTRPGTEARRTPRPINCTSLIKLCPNINNILVLNWIPDAKTYVFSMDIVKKLTSEILLHKLKEKGSRSSEETKNYIIKKLADVDPDLATTSYRFSLLCPLGKMRMAIPAKSINCDHLQCFDASLFLQMNEKKPTWMCPTCNNPCLYDDIQIENYFLEVVSSPKIGVNTKEIEILADGTWKVYEETEAIKNENVPDKEKPIDSVDLDDSDDGNDEGAMDTKKDIKPESSKDSEILKSSFIDLTLSDEDEESPKEKEKQENEAQAMNAVQSATAVDLKPQAQVQPQQAVTSSEQGVVIEIDSPSPPSSPIPTTSAS